jgi:glyceraldehyde 3-phosphate dehydrogenase
MIKPITTIPKQLTEEKSQVFKNHTITNFNLLGTFDADIKQTGDNEMSVNGHRVQVFNDKEAKNFNWGDAGAEYIADCSGAYLTKDKAQAHINIGGKKIVMSAPPKDDTPMYVMGVNHTEYKKEL